MPNPELEATNAAREPGPQPDPALKEGPASSSRKWAVSLIIAAVLLAVMYGITTHRADTRCRRVRRARSWSGHPPEIWP